MVKTGGDSLAQQQDLNPSAIPQDSRNARIRKEMI